MKKTFTFLFCLSLIFFPLFNWAIAQSSGKPYNPMTADGAIGIGTSGHILYWENPDSVIFNEVYFSQDSNLVSSLDTSVRIFNGSPSIAVDSVLLDIAGNLINYKNYYWTVVEHYPQAEITGNIWHFISRINPSYQPVLIDDFENGTSRWNIETSSGCGWDTSGVENYMLPPEAQGKVFAANADACGERRLNIFCCF